MNPALAATRSTPPMALTSAARTPAAPHAAAEAIERAALQDLYAAAPPALAAALGLSGTTVGDAFVGSAAALPASAIVVNRAVGLGAAPMDHRAGTARRLAAVLTAWRMAGVARAFLHRTTASAAELPDALLATHGLAPARAWQSFARDAAVPPPAVRSDLEVRAIGPAQGAAFARIACAAFDLGAAAEPWLAQLPGRPGWHVFMSFAGDEPVGTGALFVRDGLGWMDWAATAPAHRRHGSQAALLARRIAQARALGCTRLVTCTGAAVPGDPQHSYRNLLKAGFVETTLRENFVWCAPAAAR